MEGFCFGRWFLPVTTVNFRTLDRLLMLFLFLLVLQQPLVQNLQPLPGLMLSQVACL